MDGSPPAHTALKCLVIVAHPDDEVIWMGGTILRHSDWHWNILTLCRANDPDRATRFAHASSELRARSYMSDLDDSPVLAPLSPDLVEIKDRIRELVPKDFDHIFTHGPRGEYTRHLRHEQVSRAVRDMVESGELTGNVFTFAYEDCAGTCRPHPSTDADILINLTISELSAKKRIVKDIYGFKECSFEFESAGMVEGFQVCKVIPTIDNLQYVLASTH